MVGGRAAQAVAALVGNPTKRVTAAYDEAFSGSSMSRVARSTPTSGNCWANLPRSQQRGELSPKVTESLIRRGASSSRSRGVPARNRKNRHPGAMRDWRNSKASEFWNSRSDCKTIRPLIRPSIDQEHSRWTLHAAIPPRFRASLPSSKEPTIAMAVTFDNRITRMLGVDIPIANAPMGGVVTRDLVAATAEAGAIGVLPNAMTRDRESIRAVRELTARPLGANIHAGAAEKTAIDVFVEEGIRFVSTCIGPVPTNVPQMQEAGLKVFHVSPPWTRRSALLT